MTSRSTGRTVTDMDRDQAEALMPSAYAVALRLWEQGATAEMIASEVDVELEAVDALLAIGRAKLAALMAEACDSR